MDVVIVSDQESVEQVRTHCITQGLGTILQARQLCSWLTGLGKPRPSRAL